MKEVYLSGNSLSSKIPEIWKKLGGVEKIRFSKMGLVGEIQPSMGFYLKNLTFLGLYNNNLEGLVPEEFGFLLKSANEINLEKWRGRSEGEVEERSKVMEMAEVRRRRCAQMRLNGSWV
ncbi:unnamed protein product [Vicia faba]|uniref:Uncharacterized protein n=1 Tax=Vicia faba TaxID=3906 RepID=A0AAV0ZZY2_VICFA|nr:unnamed protein product [Vicia faba]